jgi:hypothetical protein
MSNLFNSNLYAKEVSRTYNPNTNSITYQWKDVTVTVDLNQYDGEAINGIVYQNQLDEWCNKMVTGIIHYYFEKHGD